MFGSPGIEGDLFYRSSYDSKYGCGPHSVFVRCFNAKFNKSLATEIIDSNSGSFTCTNCCSGEIPIGNLLCTDNCGILTPPPGKYYTCGGNASCTCQLNTKNVTCSSGKGNASGELCIDDCTTGYLCNEACLCEGNPDIAIRAESSYCAFESGSVKSYFSASISPPPGNPNDYECTLWVNGIQKATAKPNSQGSLSFAAEASDLDQNAQWHVSCIYKGKVSYISLNSPIYTCALNCSLGYGELPGALCTDDCTAKYGQGWKCRDACGGCFLDKENVLCSSGKGVTNNATQLCVNDCKEKLGEGYVCNGQCKCELKPPETVNCSAGMGNASGQLCINDCSTGYICNSQCKCEIKPVETVNCSAGTGNESGQLCVNDCKEKLGAEYICNGQCKCEKLPPETVKCSAGIGNASGLLCVNDCPANYYCKNDCTCAKNTSSISYCSEGKGYAAICLDDCASKLGQDYICDVRSCTCAYMGGEGRIALPSEK